jgi:RND family efflux transporter MFP subunit
MSDLSSDLAALKIDHDDPHGSGGSGGSSAIKALIWVAILGVLGAAAYLYGWPALQAAAFKTEVELTEIVVVSPAQASVELTASGYVAAEKSSKIAPKVPGTVKAVFVKQSEKVKAGQVLLEMDPTDEKAAISAAKSRAAAAAARAASAKAQIATAEAQIREARQQAERETKLAAEGISPSGVADDLRARVDSLEETKGAAEAAHKAARAETRALRAEVEVLETNMGNLQLTSPIDGTVMNKPPQLGEFIGPQPAGVSVDMGGIEIADFSTLVVEVDVPEQRLHLVQIGGPTEIVLDAFPQKRLRGKVLEVTPKVDRAKATVMVKIAFVDEFDRALPEMSARVSFLTEALDASKLKEPPKTIVPSSAITERAGAKVVFVLEDETVRMTPVSLGPAFAGGFELQSGPRPGTRLVKDPPDTLADGQRVKEREPQ